MKSVSTPSLKITPPDGISDSISSVSSASNSPATSPACDVRLIKGSRTT